MNVIKVGTAGSTGFDIRVAINDIHLCGTTIIACLAAT